ncbi:hypothetical protein CEXT_29961 [Caerostris extrusa]|uniref:Uncharacterized protein n=1 Tax=Caerostris extrusa TaxID=172846 RepID=A0AAV4YBS5_CAEEX|nr:hypothetical protein CEXT_29961 [Caerostris extrusa]
MLGYNHEFLCSLVSRLNKDSLVMANAVKATFRSHSLVICISLDCHVSVLNLSLTWLNNPIVKNQIFSDPLSRIARHLRLH